MKILLTDTGYIDPSPIRDAGHDVVLFDEAAPVPVEHRDAEGLVLWGGGGSGSAAVLADMPGYLTRLRWIQTLAAGPDNVGDASAWDILPKVTPSTNNIILDSNAKLDRLKESDQIGRAHV